MTPWYCKRTLPHYAMGKSIDIICFLWNSMKLERNNPSVLHPSLPSKLVHTGKSLSEALIFASTNPQYDYILFIELQVLFMKIPSSNLGRTCWVQKLCDIPNNFCTQYVLPLFCKKKSF